MAYNDDAVLARLSSLNESHDSIATAAQWIMFHRRHADRTVQLWLQRLKDSSSSKRLSLIYLANEVAQQSRIRHKEDFITAFSPVIAEASSIAYKGAPTDLQGKLRRVVEVWKERSIFEAPIQSAIDTRLDELDRVRGPSKSGLGGSIFGGSSTVPSEFTPLITAHQNTAKLLESTNKTVQSAEQEYTRQTDPAAEVPSAPVYAARLNGLIKTMAGAEKALAERLKSREALIVGLEKLLNSTRELQTKDEESAASLAARKTEVEDKKQQVEVGIMRALGSAEAQGAGPETNQAESGQELDRPEMEALTPPAMETFTPPEVEAFTPPPMHEDPFEAEPTAAVVERPRVEDEQASRDAPLGSLPISTNGSNKRRRVDDGDVPDLGNDGIDPDVATMLRDGN